MAYQTGTVTSTTALKSVIESFCTSNGWLISGSDYLYKGQSFVKLTYVTDYVLSIGGANSSDGLTTPCPYTHAINIAAGSWPVEYYLFYQANPDQVVCVLVYDTSKVQTIMFGDIVKVHSDAFVGGNWFFGARTNATITKTSYLSQFSDTAILVGETGVSGLEAVFSADIPFAPSAKSPTVAVQRQGFHAEIDGDIWHISSDTTYYSSSVRLADYTIQEIYRSPNIWNSQAVLVPMHITYNMASSLRAYLGYIEHIRLVRIDNYDLGDIITLGSDRWKVFPWLQKNSTYRNGTNDNYLTDNSSGTLGFAVRYDGP